MYSGGEVQKQRKNEKEVISPMSLRNLKYEKDNNKKIILINFMTTVFPLK